MVIGILNHMAHFANCTEYCAAVQCVRIWLAIHHIRDLYWHKFGHSLAALLLLGWYFFFIINKVDLVTECARKEGVTMRYQVPIELFAPAKVCTKQ